MPGGCETGDVDTSTRPRALDRLAELERRLDAGLPPSPDVSPGAPIDVPPPGAPPISDQPSRPGRGPRRARTLLLVSLGLVVTLLLGALSALVYLRWRVGQVERVEVAHVLAPTPASGPTWLLVGSDSRDGIDPDRPDAGGLLGVPVVGQRADAIILVRDVPGVGVQMLSLPRDLWLDPPGPSNATRINAAFNRGAAPLVELIRDELGIEVHRYVEVDLAGLDDIVDAIGGVTVEIPHPGHDASIGLSIETSGAVHLDGMTALQYVRTRKWTEVIDGRQVVDGTGDIGRNQRQQAVLSALGSKLGSMRNPLAVNAAVSGIVDAVRVDDGAGLRDMYGLARMLQRAERAPALPVVPHITGGGASVLLLGRDADAVLDPFRQTG